MSVFYIDCETTGFCGPPVLIQYAKDDGPVQLHSIWTRPIHETMTLIEEFLKHDIVMFNMVFDAFMLCKIYTMFYLYPDKNATPEDIIEELAIIEERARFVDLCLKPKRCCDVMLLCRRGPYQSLMERSDIKIRRVPTTIAWHIARELENRIKFDDIYFSRAKDRYAPRWKIYDIKTENGNINPDFKDIVLKFKASGSLKNLYRHIFKVKEEIFTFGDVDVDPKFHPEELGYAPFALATGSPEDWKHTWPDLIGIHISHWAFSQDARKYAANDVEYLRRIHKEHLGSPEPGDNDSELAWSVAACRWRGFAIDGAMLVKLKNDAREKIERLSKFAGIKRKGGKHHSAMPPKQAKRYLFEVMDETEKAAIHGSTKRVILEEIAEWQDDCPDCKSGEDCKRCGNTNVIPHKASIRAKEILDARKAEKEIEIYDKLLTAGRFHASFKIIGTLSSRMSGSDGLNAQGIKHDKYVRAAFTLADLLEQSIEFHLPNGMRVSFQTACMILCGGDFKAFEVSIAAKVFDDPKLNEAITSGKKIHAMLGMELFPGQTYEQILASDGQDPDMYDKGKKGVFLMFYGGDANTFKNKLGIALEIGQPAFERFINKHKGIKLFNQTVDAHFLALKQPGGIGSKIEYHEPNDYAESMLGFRRYFTLENRIVKELFTIAQDPPPSIKSAKIKVLRRDRIQTAGGAAQSALYGAAFGIVSGIIRAVKNHFIQSPGAEITKATQRAIWDLQPCGIHQWNVQPLNVHDEIMVGVRAGVETSVKSKVEETVSKFKEIIPLLAIDWVNNIPNWAKKKG
jgi:hypothetical protein